jgi:D-lactate dehydrogenase
MTELETVARRSQSSIRNEHSQRTGQGRHQVKVAIFSTKPYDREFLSAANGEQQHELVFLEPRLARETVALAAGFPAVCVFVNDQLDAQVLAELAAHGTRIIALRCAGFNNVDLDAARALGQTVVRVPAYSPHAVAEHTIALILALNRKIPRAFNRVREGNFALDGLLGFDLHGRTTGVVGTGRIGALVARVMQGFGSRVVGFDPYPNPECEAMGMEYVSLKELCHRADIITLHCPLTPDTHHLISHDTLREMKPGAMLVNTSRGAVLDTRAVIDALKSGRLGSLALDVYEEEADLFFEDLSRHAIQDDVFARLLTFPNVLITAHQAFFTSDALEAIARITLSNITDIENGQSCPNEVRAELVTA